MIAVIALLSFICIALPIGFAWRLWRLELPTRLGWLIVLAETAVLVGLILLLGRWDIAGLWTRMALAALLVGAALVSAFRHLRRPWWEQDALSVWRGHGLPLASLALFGAALVYVTGWGGMARHEPRALTFPLQGGWFVVAQGGGIGILNHHASHPAQRHALDITAVDAAGFRAAGLLPEDPARYAIFGKTVVSPCAGTATAAVDGLPDLPPPTADRANPAGNHVVLACGELQIELAHLRKGSVVVEVGRQIAAGAAIGQVGNSGNSTEPHLHIHAVDQRSGAGVQMSFDGIVPIRNTFFAR
ncbi:M23 family metallopeptidase [Bosea sp. NPDC003192]|uniref:M23 family metallopeptidase n=1 Tax=Bosea sp. NPDC003192 TaxID=3390551 RepID=UPI003D0479DB